jgi:hypothetical protein
LSLNQRNSKKQGDVGLGSAIAFLSSMGYTICIPLTDSQDYDLVVEIEDVLYKLQVKTTRYKPKGKNVYQAGLRTNGGNRSGKGTTKRIDKEKVDYLFIVTGDNGKYFIPTSNVSVSNCINLGSKYDKFKVSN